MISTEKILIRHKVNPTVLRIKVLDALIDSGKSYSCTEMKINIDRNRNPDRVTIYRIFNLLHRANLVGTTVDKKGITRYFYSGGMEDVRPSFRCRSCGLIVSLQPLDSYYSKNLSDFKVENILLSFTGLCGSCSNEND